MGDFDIYVIMCGSDWQSGGKVVTVAATAQEAVNVIEEQEKISCIGMSIMHVVLDFFPYQGMVRSQLRGLGWDEI